MGTRAQQCNIARRHCGDDFFSISGFLVTQSWLSDRNAFRFCLRRVLRIWPALTIVVIIAALALGPVVTTLSINDYLIHGATWDYFQALIMRIHFVLPGVFNDNPGGASVNGSLWTIPYEVRCYIVMAIIGFLGLLRGNKWIIAWGVVFFVWYINKGIPDIIGHYVPGREFSAYFVLGTMLYCVKDKWLPHAWLAMGLAVVLACVLYWFNWRYLALLMAIPICAIGFGMQSTPFFKRFGRFGDPSFGIYLYAYPVQQTLLHYTYPELNFYISMFIAAVITVTLAYVSWYWIEKPALRLKPSKRATA